MTHPEVWAGIECTINRVGDRFFDQFERSGHRERDRDLELFAALGIKAMRYPVLWEHVEAHRASGNPWTWSDRQLERLRTLGIRPIVGLLHHGSGPRHTSLIDQRFPELFADHARATARRYPWVDEWTPINEPLTTARFSGLYGLWYPHGADDRTFLAALVGQCHAIALAMSAIRTEIPHARLVQTEDMGKTWSTPELAYQADFDNHRRWLSLDLLSGLIDRTHPLYAYLIKEGITEAELDWFEQHPCRPDLIGINHYLTSERYLDHRLHLFPAGTHGGNGRDRYADVEAVRACAIAGPIALLRETWERYRLPIAVTEAHLHCTREEQLRWFMEIWNGAVRLESEGVDIRAVTAWAGLGAYDWNSLLTRDVGHYEAGLFDLRGPEPRPTAIASMVAQVASGEHPSHPLLEVPGWWRRDVRILYDVEDQLCHQPIPEGVRPLLITGRTGTLGRAFARVCQLRGIPFILTSREDLDIADEASLEAALDRHRPWAVINTAGFVRVDEAEEDVDRCWRENFLGPSILARVCGRIGIPHVDFSSDLVFGGDRSSPYRESDRASPLGMYGRAKGQAERRIVRSNPAALVVRTAAFFSPWDQVNFVSLALEALRAGRRFSAYADITVSPTYVPDLVNAVLDLLVDQETGIWHVANQGSTSWIGLAQRAAALADVDASGLQPISAPSHIPRYSALTSERAVLLEPWSDALLRYCVIDTGTSAKTEG